MSTFTAYRDFYSASNGGNGTGLADFSNRNFFSAGTNANGSNPLPALVNMTATTDVVEPDRWYWPGSGKMKIYVGNVDDYASDIPTSVPVKLTVSGAFDQFMKAKGLSSHTLNTIVYDDMAAHLVPRAAGYTTSFVSFLFRTSSATAFMSPRELPPLTLLVSNHGT